MTRVVISDPGSGKAYQIEPEESLFKNLIGLRVGEQFDGDKIDISGYKFRITGGSDEEGFPMRADVRGEGRTRSLFGGGSGYNPQENGEKRRKTVRGNRVSGNIAQLNIVIEEMGDKSIEQALGLEQSPKESENEANTDESEESKSEEEE